jgi:hypothetical protein
MGRDRMAVLWETQRRFPSGAFCPPGQEPAFVQGIGVLHEHVGEVMGVPTECEHKGDNGDIIQRTSTGNGQGLAYWRNATNTPSFTDGYNHWALTYRGVVHWVGDNPDPPR